MKFNNIKEKISLYGYTTTIQLILKKILHSLFRITWNGHYILYADTREVKEPTLENNIIIRNLKIEDYNTEEYKYFLDERRENIYIERLNNPNIEGLGLFINNKLAFSTWINFEILHLSEKIKLNMPLDSALIFDSYSHPNYRRKGYHKMMNLFRLHRICEKGKTKAITFVLSYNKPSINSLKKAGFEVATKFYTYKIGKKEYATISSEQIKKIVKNNN